jgi:pSer/pThr/pTyr-binding forkhead associated (FHA) protein
MASSMRLSFANNEHPDVLVAPGATSIGSAPDNTVVIASAGINPHHAILTVSERSIVLSTVDAPTRAHVNARPVQEKAMLRLGDAVSLDTVTFVLKPDRDDLIQTNLPATGRPAGEDADKTATTRALPARVVLRGVSGPWFGKIVPVRGRLSVGSGSDCELVLDDPDVGKRQAAIEVSGDSIFLRGADAGGYSAVNGVATRDAVLYPDDQIAFGRNRFVIEAPSLPIRENAIPQGGEVNITQTMRAIPKSAAPAPAPPAVDDNAKNDIWWLIGAAALIAIGIAVLLYVSF